MALAAPRRSLQDLLALAESELVVAEEHRGALARRGDQLEVVGEDLALSHGVDGRVDLDLRPRLPALLEDVDQRDGLAADSSTARAGGRRLFGGIAVVLVRGVAALLRAALRSLRLRLTDHR